MKKSNRKKIYKTPLVKIIKFKDIDFKTSMRIRWRGFDEWTGGIACGGLPK